MIRLTSQWIDPETGLNLPASLRTVLATVPTAGTFSEYVTIKVPEDYVPRKVLAFDQNSELVYPEITLEQINSGYAQIWVRTLADSPEINPLVLADRRYPLTYLDLHRILYNWGNEVILLSRPGNATYLRSVTQTTELYPN